MAIIIRIDVDRPYGKRPKARHLLSRFGSDLWLPRIQSMGYLRELREMLEILGECGAPAHAFFRRCTYPSDEILELVTTGGHEIGLHLEDSRTYDTFEGELRSLEKNTGVNIRTFSKHGSGMGKFGRRHYAPYEPERYREWADRVGMRAFFGNLEDPSIQPDFTNGKFAWFPSAFWLEPPWRDTEKFDIDWLITRAAETDLVMLVHPEGILEDPDLVRDFRAVIENVESRVFH